MKKIIILIILLLPFQIQAQSNLSQILVNENIVQEEIEGGIYYEGEDLISEYSELPFSFKFNLYESAAGNLIFENGQYRNTTGNLSFDVVIDKDRISELNTIFDLLISSEAFRVMSFSEDVQNFFTFIENEKALSERYHIVKSDDEIDVLLLSLEFEEGYYFEFKGALKVIDSVLFIESGAYKINNIEYFVKEETLDSFLSNIIAKIMLEIND